MDGICLGYPAPTRCASLPHYLSPVLTPTPSDAPDNPAVHATFLILLLIFLLALFCTVFYDPGVCETLTKDALKPVRSISPKYV
jgi:hypothetical protein